jgi:hypothetical protein
MYAADAVLYRAKEAGRNRDVVAYGKQAFRCAQNDEQLPADTTFPHLTEVQLFSP